MGEFFLMINPVLLLLENGNQTIKISADDFDEYWSERDQQS